MDILAFLIPGGILLALVGLYFFFWTVGASQYDDLEGAAHRILLDDDTPCEPSSTPSEKP